MPLVSIRHIVAATADEVWKVVLDCESFPTFMDEVLEVSIRLHEPAFRRSYWRVLLKGSELEWEEEEIIDHVARRIDFDQTDGDLALFNGYWQVSAQGGRTTVELHVEFDIGIPLMAEILNPVAARALEDNSRAILNQIGDKALIGTPESS